MIFLPAGVSSASPRKPSTGRAVMNGSSVGASRLQVAARRLSSGGTRVRAALSVAISAGTSLPYPHAILR
jgi:hypothetical protein